MLRFTCIKRLSALVLAAVLFAALPVYAGDLKDGVGMSLTSLSSVTFAGDPVDGSIFYEADLTVINIWQRWCGPCWAEMPGFLHLFQHYSATPEADVQLWGALYYDSYTTSTIPEAVDFVQQNGYNWDHMLICDELIMVASGGDPEAYYPVPQTIIVDRYGVVRAQVFGSITEEDELFELVEHWLDTVRSEYAAGLGDVDGNGMLTFADVSRLYQYCVGAFELSPELIFKADVNGSGSVNFADVSALYQLMIL